MCPQNSTQLFITSDSRYFIEIVFIYVQVLVTINWRLYNACFVVFKLKDQNYA